jgi:lysozyme
MTTSVYSHVSLPIERAIIALVTALRGNRMATINPLFVDLSHWDPAEDYDAVKAEGIVAVVYKATEGQFYTDDTYVEQQHMAKSAGLKWGAYHFADSSDVYGQIDNFLRFACPDPDELFCLDWEDNPSGAGCMSVGDVKTWITEVENALRRPGECVLYSGNTAKEALGDTVDEFLGARRLWLCQYGSNPTWQRSWSKYWAWQFTDGEYGPTPHSINGIGHCDINSYDSSAEQLVAEWASGSVPTRPPPAVRDVVTVLINAPPNVEVKVRRFSFDAPHRMHRGTEGRD